MTSTHDFHNVDDLMAIADATGVTRRDEPMGEGTLLIHPSLRDHLTDGALGEVLEIWTRLPIDLVPTDQAAAVELYECENPLCDEVVDETCQHNELLCSDHRLDCERCLDDYCSDGACS